MPLTLKKPSKSDYRPLIEKLEKRLEGWKARFITRAGRLQLIKAVLSTIPTYFMSCFKFRKWLLQRIDVIRRQFLWSRNGNDRPVHLLNWQSVCLPIKCGGMGVVNLQLQNMALLMRWLWRLYAPDRKLWAMFATMIHAVQPQPDGPLFLASSGSFFWKALLNLKQLFHCSATSLPVSGKTTSFWFDKWCDQILASMVIGAPTARWISLHDAKGMADQLFSTPLTPFHHHIIHSLEAFTPIQGTYGITWNLTNSGLFSVKSIYNILSQCGKEN